MVKYLFSDSEFGGFCKDRSLLSAYFAITDNELNIEDDLDLSLIPDDGRYIVEPKALEVNGINLVELAAKAITYKQAKSELYRFLSMAHSEDKKDNVYPGSFPDDMKLIPIGHGISGDIRIYQETIISKGSWDGFVSYRVIDTSSLCQALKYKGKIPDSVSGSLTSLAEYFELEWTGKAHTAKTDTLMNIQVFKELMKLI